MSRTEQKEGVAFLKLLLNITGNVTIQEAISWLDVEENARRLKEEVKKDKNEE